MIMNCGCHVRPSTVIVANMMLESLEDLGLVSIRFVSLPRYGCSLTVYQIGSFDILFYSVPVLGFVWKVLFMSLC